jgi:hypothetical protein
MTWTRLVRKIGLLAMRPGAVALGVFRFVTRASRDDLPVQWAKLGAVGAVSTRAVGAHSNPSRACGGARLHLVPPLPFLAIGALARHYKEVIMLMPMAHLRFGLALATLLASLHVAAETRYWALTGVGFPGGQHATGYFSYDDATQTISNWNVEVDPFFQGIHFPGFSYVPANSTASVIPPPGAGMPTFLFSATMGVPGPFFGVRELRITPLAALDGNNATVSIVTGGSRDDFPSVIPPPGVPWTALGWIVVAGSVTLMPGPPTTTIVQVDEFYHPALRHYFITANAAEKQILDSAVQSGWQRTGQSFKAYARGSNTSGSVSPVCRFYSPEQICNYYACAPGLDSHFFSADAAECLIVSRRFRIYQEEMSNAFQIDAPDKVTGACRTGTTPVYRLWNQRPDSNHRYTTRATIRAEMVAAGYLEEGVAMCAVE